MGDLWSVMPDVSTLSADGWEVDIVPSWGGAVSRCQYQGVDILRHATAALSAPFDPVNLSCFPLVPYSNRIGPGVLDLSQTHPEIPLPIHGHGWCAQWDVMESTTAHLSMMHQHQGVLPGGWPYPYEAIQEIFITERKISFILKIRNIGAAEMPAGIGFHPYFPKTDQCTVATKFDQYQTSDEAGLPLSLAEVPADFAFDIPTRITRTITQPVLDHCFTGWSRQASIVWPEKNCQVMLEAGPALGHLIIYAPPGADYFCLEPVSHLTNALYQQYAGIESGWRMIQAGEALTDIMTLTAAL